MKNLFRLQNLNSQQIHDILNLAEDIKNGKNKDKLDNKIIANLFFEPSTRTQYSFIMAEHLLNCKVIDFAPGRSSINKGETFYDTIKTFESFGVDAIIIRDRKNKWYKDLENKIHVPIINGGDGMLDHPTQTLLDLMTIKQSFGHLEGLKILIVGDIAHSRVAHSNIENMRNLGMEVFISAPKNLQDPQYEYVDFDEYIPKVDVINMLRIQNERLEDKVSIDKDYNNKHGLNIKRVNKMKPNAIIIHPGPFDRNMEINDEVVEHQKSKIFSQTNNGVYIRMAVLLKILKKDV